MRKILMLFLCSALAPAIWGYGFRAGEVSRVENIPQDKQQTDDNGNVLAVLSVETDIPGLRFDTSGLGQYGIERTEKGYELRLPYGSRWLLLRAPGFKAYHWDFGLKPGGLRSAVYYRAGIGRTGSAPRTDSASNFDITGEFEYNMWDLAVRFSEDKRPMLKINTDLPFSFLQAHLLQEGSYEAQETDMAPYELRVSNASALRDIVRKEAIRGDIGWEMRLESPNVYWLDLSWTDKKYGQALARDLQKAIKESTPRK